MDKSLRVSTAFVMSPRTAFDRIVDWIDRVTKRTIDIAAALAGLLLLAPFFLLVGIIIKRDSAGPVLYRGRRVGRCGREFGILKFRTMKESPESYDGPKLTAQDDRRVTSVGRWLRQTKINELPQFWNVLKGEMSLVGPRPEDPDIVARWPEEVRAEILSIRPGITSPASVLYRDEESLLGNGNVMQTYLQSVLPSKLRLDQLYVRHRSFWLDMDILFWTVLVLLPLLGSFVPAEESLFLGPLARVGRRYVSWFAVDTLITLSAIGTAGILWRLSAPLDIGVPYAMGIALGFAFLFSITGSVLGMNRIAWSQAWASDALRLVFSAMLATGVALIVNEFWSKTPFVPRSMLLFASTLALMGFITVRYRSRLVSGLAYRWLERTGSAVAARERVLIVGGGTTGQFVAWLLSGGSGGSVFRVIGFVDDDLYKQGIQYHGIRVVGRRTDIQRLVEQHDAGIVVFAIHNIDAVERERLLAICRSTAARILIVPDIVGALNDIVWEKSNGKGDHAPAPAGETVPLHTAPVIPAAQAQAWLSDLEKAAKAGDLAGLDDHIRSIREGIQKLGA